MRVGKRIKFLAGAVLLTAGMTALLPGSGTSVSAAGGEKVTLRIANWEEYIDEGGWSEEEAIELEMGWKWRWSIPLLGAMRIFTTSLHWGMSSISSARLSTCS